MARDLCGIMGWEDGVCRRVPGENPWLETLFWQVCPASVNEVAGFVDADLTWTRGPAPLVGRPEHGPTGGASACDPGEAPITISEQINGYPVPHGNSNGPERSGELVSQKPTGAQYTQQVGILQHLPRLQTRVQAKGHFTRCRTPRTPGRQGCRP